MGGAVAKDAVQTENDQRRTSSAQLRSLKDLAVNSIGRARKSNPRNAHREVIEDLHVAMIAGPARADRNATKIIVTNSIISPSQTNPSLRLR